MAGVSSKPKVSVPYERIDTKVPIGLYRDLEEVLRTRQQWPSRQDFVIEAIKEKLERLRQDGPARRR